LLLIALLSLAGSFVSLCIEVMKVESHVNTCGIDRH
jgi:hypothetical protein